MITRNHGGDTRFYKIRQTTWESLRVPIVTKAGQSIEHAFYSELVNRPTTLDCKFDIVGHHALSGRCYSEYDDNVKEEATRLSSIWADKILSN